MTPSQAVGNLTGLGWWFQVERQFNWYVPAILVLYLLSPLFFECIQRGKTPWVFAALVVLNIAGWNSNLLMALSRFPTYFLGMYMGAQYASGKAPTRRALWGWSIVGVAAIAAVPWFFLRARWTLWRYGMFWNLFFCSTPACLFGVTKLLALQEKTRLGCGFNRLMAFLGERSFEIYLCHLAFYECCLRMGLRGWPQWLLAALVGTCLGIGYHELVAWVQRQRKPQKVIA
jgi:peptidoglycan/LPS O-acetylase OafA/YrhL